MATTTRTTTRDGFDLVLTRERDGWTASIYRAGRQIPLRRRLVADEAAADRWFADFLRGPAK